MQRERLALNAQVCENALQWAARNLVREGELPSAARQLLWLKLGVDFSPKSSM